MSRYSSIQKYNPFIMKIDNTIAGSSGVGSFTLVLSNSNQLPSSTPSHRFKVDWGDGVVSAITETVTSVTSPTHTYSSSGTYFVKVYGKLPWVYYNNDADGDKIITIESWGNIYWKSFAGSFRGSDNFTGITTTESPIFEKVDNSVSTQYSLSSAFYSCPNFDADIGSWDVSGVGSFYQLFRVATSFNNGGSPSISGWTFTTPNTSFQSMFRDSNFNQPIGNWDTSNVSNMIEMFRDNTTFNQDLSSWDVGNVTSMFGMFDDVPSFDQDLGSWNVSGVTSMGSMFGWGTPLFNNGGSPSISGWTTTSCNAFDYMFYLATSFNQPIGSWDVSNCSNFNGMFRSAGSFNQDIGSWDVSNATTMADMFNLATNFNQDLSSWNVSGVTNMHSTFENADSFNQNIGSWDVSGVEGISTSTSFARMFNKNDVFNNGGSPSISGWTFGPNDNSMYEMFYGATSFNQPIGSWDVSNVTNMAGMFYFTPFNQDIGSWDVSGARYDVSSIFLNASSFNNGGSPSISGWTFGTPSNGHDFGNMFQSASVFNQPIGSWTWPTGSVTKMDSMFYSPGGSDFNQDIGSWDVSGVEGSGQFSFDNSGFYRMFGSASSFNNGGSPSISGWTFGPNDNTMNLMFNGATNFNQPIGSWNVSGVTNMRNMFSSTTNFNQDIGSWDVSTGTDDKFNSMFFDATAFNNGGSPSISGWTFGNYGPNFTLNGMFWNADSFNQPIGSWNVSGVTNMWRMFKTANNFNQDIGSWDVSGVKGTDTFSGFNEMFQGSINFNNGGSPSISGWTFGPNPVTMKSMFESTLFNQPIGLWDVSNVTNMANMLQATPFNQYIGSWDVSGVTDMTQMLDSTNTSVTNYNSILTGWTGWNGSTATKTLQSNVSFGCTNCNYSSGSTAEQARNYLITGLTWTITDAGGI